MPLSACKSVFSPEMSLYRTGLRQSPISISDPFKNEENGNLVSYAYKTVPDESPKLIINKDTGMIFL